MIYGNYIHGLIIHGLCQPPSKSCSGKWRRHLLLLWSSWELKTDICYCFGVCCTLTSQESNRLLVPWWAKSWCHTMMSSICSCCMGRGLAGIRFLSSADDACIVSFMIFTDMQWDLSQSPRIGNHTKQHPHSFLFVLVGPIWGGC